MILLNLNSSAQTPASFTAESFLSKRIYDQLKLIHPLLPIQHMPFPLALSTFYSLSLVFFTNSLSSSSKFPYRKNKPPPNLSLPAQEAWGLTLFL